MAELGQLSYSIILDDKKFNKQAQGIVKKLKDVDTQINELMSSDSTRLSKPFDLAGMSIEKMVTQAKVLEVAFKGLSQSGTGVLSQDAINLKLRWQEIQAEVAKYGLNLKSSLMEQQKIVEPLKNLQQVLAMPANSLDEVAAKLSEVKRIRAEQIQTDASYISNMSVLNKVEGELIAQQKSAIFIGKEALTVEQQLTSELQKRPISINDIIASAKNLEVLYKSLDDKESALGVEAQQRWLGMRDQLQSYGYVIKSSVMEQQTLNGALAMQENTVGQIELKMRALSAVRKGINITEKESIETLKKVNDEYMRLGDQLKKVGARQYNLADLARNTNGAFSPLGFSIQQVARELPSLTMGAQMFFLAISNNLPILSDELRKAKESYKALVAEGKTAVPVWKQVISSIFSWQTAMVVGITLLTMYGREIGNWIKGLFGASKANEELAKSLDEINKSYSKAILEGSKNAQKELTNLNLLYKASQNDRKSKEERKKAVDELQKQYPTYFKNLTNEQILAGKGADAYMRLSKAIIEASRARAAADKITENQSKILDLEAKNTEILVKREKIVANISRMNENIKDASTGQSAATQSNFIKQQNEQLKEQDKLISDNVDQINALNKANDRLAKNININDLTFDTKEHKSTSTTTPKTPNIYSRQDKFTQEQIREAEDTATKIEQARIDAMDDSFEKRMAQMKLNHEVEIREIRRNRDDLLREIIDNERKLFEAEPKNKGKKFDSSGVTLSTDQEQGYSNLISERINVQIAERIRGIREMKKFAEEERLTFASELDQQIFSIKEHYEERRRMAKGNSDLIKQINNNENKEISAARLQAKQRQLESDAEYNQKYQELLSDRYVFESDKRKAAIEQQIRDQKKILNALEKQVLNDPNNYELANQLRDALIQLRLLNKELEKTPAQKLGEIASVFNQISSGLSDITGVDFSMIGNSLSGIASFASKDYLGAATAGFGIISGFVSGIISKKEQEAAIQREINKLQQQYNIDLRQQNYDLISSIDYARAFRDNIEALQWLVEKGFISNVDYSVWETLNAQAQEANKNILAAQQNYDKVKASAEVVLNEAYRLRNKPVWEKYKDIAEDWKNGLISTEEAQRRLAASGVKGASEHADAIARAEEETQKWKDQIAELSQQMDEFATGTSFDSFLSDAMSAIDNMRKGVSDLSDFTEESLTNAVLSSFKYQVLAEALKPFYDTLADKFIDDFDNLDKDWGDKWQSDLEAKLKELGIKFDDVFGNLGIDNSSGNRTGLSGSLARASQDSIDELTGVMYAGLEKLSLSSNGINAINITTTAMSAELKAQTTLLRSIDNYSSRLPYIESGINIINQRGIKINP